VLSHSSLLAITVFTPALAGCLLLLSWLQHRKVIALALWGLGFITASVATTLIIVLRGRIPDFWSIIVGNALLTAAYGILWSGARKFDGKNVSIPLALMGVESDSQRQWRLASGRKGRCGNNLYRAEAGPFAIPHRKLAIGNALRHLSSFGHCMVLKRISSLAGSRLL
jgi:hypothetical protein